MTKTFSTYSYHIAQDMLDPEGSNVYAISDGDVVKIYTTDSNDDYGLGTGNSVIFVKHTLQDGSQFLAEYMHVRPTVHEGDHITGGNVIALVGPYQYDVPHLHFGIHPSLTVPTTNWGRMANSAWAGTNGFVDPVNWIQTHSPYGFSSTGGGSNPSPADIRAKLVAAGQKWQIPPHILFGIAWQESSWRQFDNSGNTVISPDGGIGIMQLTGATAAQFDVNRLKTDIDYNIDAGAKVLNDKWNETPIIGDNDRAKLENWYYSIWAYNSFYAGSPYPSKVLNWIANCPNGQWESVTITPPTPSQIASMTTIPNTPTPIHVDANFDGIIDGTVSTPPAITFNEVNKNKWAGPSDINSGIVAFTLQDNGGGIGGLSQNWDSDPGGNSPQFPGSYGGYLTMGYLPDATRQGKHTAYVRAWNGDNSQSVVATSGWYGYDALPPTVTITSAQAQGSTYNSPQNVTWHIDDPDSGIKSWGQGWDADPGDSQFSTSDGNLNLPAGTHTLHVHTVDNVGNDKDWTFGPYTYTTGPQVGENTDGSMDQRYIDDYNRVGPSVVGNVNNNYVHTVVGSSGTGGEQDFVGGSGGQATIMAKDGGAQAYNVHGNIWGLYSGMSYASSPLGFPTSDEEDADPSPQGTTGRVSHFENGAITSTPAGTYEVHGNIFGKYLDFGGSGGALGFPTQAVMVNPASIGRYGTSGNVQLFEGGGIFDSSFGTFAVDGQIWSADELQILIGVYGYPTSDQQQAPGSPFGTSGQMVNFEAGAFYDTIPYGIHGVSGDIYQQYQAAQASAGNYGFPISDAYAWEGGTKQDFEGGALIAGVSVAAHVLWTNTDGTASIWNTADAHPDRTCRVFGPFPGWSAVALADGPNGQTRLLWDNTDGRISVWNLSDPNPSASCLVYGPFPGWHGVGLTVGPDNAAHVLWDSKVGQTSVWNLNDANPAATCLVNGPFPGWSGVGLADGPNGQVRLLWDNTAGQTSVWNLSDPNPAGTCLVYGPFGGWTAKRISVGPDNTAHLLWDSAAGQTSVWNLSDANPAATCAVSGPFGGWSGVGLAVGSDSAVHLLWDNTGGPMSLWNLSDAQPDATCLVYGPYSGWTAVDVSATP